MTGEELNEYLERNFPWPAPIKRLSFADDALVLSDPSFLIGSPDSVTQQATSVDADWDAGESRLKISAKVGGPGYMLPYIENPFRAVAAPPAHSMARTKERGLGTYTPIIPDGGSVSWVVTGPFSGCYAATFAPAARDRVFAHIITVPKNPNGYTAETIEKQCEDIIRLSGGGSLVEKKQIHAEAATGFVFWTRRSDGFWWRRLIRVSMGEVKSVEMRTKV